MPTKKLALIIACSMLSLLTGCGDGNVDKHPGQPVKNRQAVFNKMLQAKDEMGMVMREHEVYDGSAFLAQARELQRLSREPWQYFTPASNYAPTRAKPRVWEKPEDFSAAQHDLGDATDQLVKVAEAGDLKAIRSAYKDVELACRSCHNMFRNNIQLH